MVDTTKPVPPTISGKLAVCVDLEIQGGSDDVGLTRYEVWDGSTYLAKLDPTVDRYRTPSLSSGEHKLRVVAYDAANNYANSNVVTIQVPESTEPTPTPTPIPTPAPSPQFIFNKLIFEDNFDILDLSKWNLYDSEGHAFNGLRKPSQWSVQQGVPGANGGCLVGQSDWVDRVKALSLIPAHLPQWKKDKLAGIISAANGAILAPGMSCRKRGTQYGRFEVRMRTEVDPSGITTSNFLTWPDDQIWPAHGENNIWETTGRGNAARNPMMTYIHYGVDNRQKYFEHPVSGADWHIVVMEWTPDFIKIYRDGVLVWTMTDKVAIPTWPHHPCLQLDATRNANPGKPIRVFYDYVKTYQ